MAYSPPYATADPTNVMGRRIGAWAIDFIPALIIVSIFGRHNATTYQNAPNDFCTTFRATHAHYFCFQSGSTVYTSQIRSGGSILIWLVYYFAIAGFMQGATGATFGKHAVGLRVVNAQGNLLTMGQAFLRTFIGIFEIGFCFLIGLITALATHPHRRLGDMAAGTYVVGKDSVGTPIPGTLAAAAYPPPWTPPGGQPGWGPPPAAGAPQWGGPPAGTQGWGPPPAAVPPVAAAPSWGTPAATPPAEAPAPAPSPAPDPSAPSEGAGWAAPAAATPPASEAQPPSEPQPAPAPAAATPPQREPQWDAQRNAWVYWEAETNRWLQHDPATGAWGPLR